MLATAPVHWSTGGKPDPSGYIHCLAKNHIIYHSKIVFHNKTIKDLIKWVLKSEKKIERNFNNQ
jgi:hypothetical protein